MVDFSALRILVVGDVMLDRFVYGDVERISPEAPVPVLRLSRTRAMLGGAGNVARNISALGGQAVLVGLLGQDGNATELRALLAADPRIADATVASAARPTISKMRVVAGNQQVVRVDDEVVTAADPTETAGLIAAIEAGVAGCQAVVLSDYAKGLLVPAVIAAALAAARTAAIPVFVDPKGEDFQRYRGAFCLTPNAKELAQATRLPVGTQSEILAAARQAMAAAGVAALLATRADKGMALVEASGASATVPAHAKEVFDVSGAGDTSIATLALAHAAGAPLAAAMRIANTAAGIVVGKLGTATASADELEHALRADAGSTLDEGRLLDRAAAARLVADWRAHGLKVGLTNGCFDILHAGHVALLRAARRRCDRLIVALNTDASTARLKGPTRPLNGLADRAAVISALAAVDAVVAFEEDTPLALIEALRPDVLVKGADYTEAQVVGAAEVRGWGGEVALIDLLPGRSTTGLLARAGEVLRPPARP